MTKTSVRLINACAATVVFFAVTAVGLQASELLVGTSTISITPRLPVNLSGQFPARIAHKVESTCTASAVALESRDGDKVLDQAIMVSCDLVAIRDGVSDLLRKKLAARQPGFDVRKVFLNATHTHTGPTMIEGRYDIPKEAIQPDEYVDFLTDRLCNLVLAAWKSRQAGGVSWGLGHAVVAYNRRMVYADGSSVMYGKTNKDNFRTVEGPEDHGVEVLFFWDKNKKLIATAINVACPAQEVESRRAVNADFWHEVRLMLQKQYGKDLCVLGWTGAAGDQSPHILWRKKAEERMREKRGLTRLEEIARRIVKAFDEVYEVAKSDIRFNVPMVHIVQDIKLPPWIVTEKEYADCKAAYDALAKKKKEAVGDGFRLWWNKRVMDNYQKQKKYRFHDMELHVLRLDDVAIATNPFELFTDYGIQMKARSKAQQTFVIQLACNTAGYLPTVAAVKGGSYSVAVTSCLVGPEGGQALVDRTVKEINELWK